MPAANVVLRAASSGLREGHFHLKHQHRVGTKQPGREIPGIRGHVGAACDRDRILAGLVDRDKGAAGRLVGPDDEAGVDFVGPEVLDRAVAKPVPADAARHPDLSRSRDPRGGNGLVGALAAEMRLVGRREHRPAGAWNDRDLRDEVDVERPEHQDHGGEALSLARP
ncbi:hypothetical protein ABH972_005912 [Bradyrhizobium ottawaense]